MNQTLTIITGASKGMGQAMAAQLLDSGSTVLAIARNTSATLESLAAHHANASLLQWQADLSDAQAIVPQLEQWLQAQKAHNWQTVQLINNAGVMPPIAALSNIAPADIMQGLRVGLEAAMVMSACFLKATDSWPAQRKILNISSGLGRRALASQAIYCAAKAGMDNFTRCLALEESLKKNGAKVCALAPGVIDTSMQEQMRNTAEKDFPGVARFKDLYTHKQLQSPAQAAQAILAYLASPDFGDHPIADIRDSKPAHQ